MKRIISMLLSVVIALSITAVVGAADPLQEFYSEKVIAHAEEASKVIAAYGKEYRFGTEGVSFDEMKEVMSLVFNENPELFHLNTNYSYTYGMDPVTDEMIVYKVLPKYTMSETEYATALAELNTWVANILSLTDPSFTDLEYALFFHDYLAANYVYDDDLGVHNAYDFIKKGGGVCQAYAYAYAILLKAVDVPVSFATSGEMNHLWNQVMIDGEWYNVDVTWDDPVGSAFGTVKHDNFLKSDKAVSTESGGHYGWLSLYACTSEKYDNIWLSSVTSPMAYLDGKWYTVYGGDLWSAETPDEEGSLCLELDMVWNVKDSSNVYTRSFSSVISIEGQIYFNSPSAIRSYDPETNAVKDVYTYTGTAGDIYGFRVNPGEDGVSGITASPAELLIAVSTAPGLKPEMISLKLKKSGGSGDLNGDGKLGLTDVSILLKSLAGWDVTADSVNGDVDGNGKVNLLDAQVMLKIIAGWT